MSRKMKPDNVLPVIMVVSAVALLGLHLLPTPEAAPETPIEASEPIGGTEAEETFIVLVQLDGRVASEVGVTAQRILEMQANPEGSPGRILYVCPAEGGTCMHR